MQSMVIPYVYKQNKVIRLLLDGGSQMTFITEVAIIAFKHGQQRP